MTADVVQFKSPLFVREREPQIQKMPTVEKCAPETPRGASIDEQEIARALGARTFSELELLAAQGGHCGSGTVELHEYKTRKGEPLDRWGFEFKQIKSSKKDYSFSWQLEIGHRLRPSQVVTLFFRRESAMYGKALICPICRELKDDGRHAWHLYCVPGKPVGCRDCLGFRFELRARIVSLGLRAQILPRTDTFHISPIAPAGFYRDRPDLCSILPGVFAVRKEGEHLSIGHFVADRRQLPVVESKRVRVEP